MSAVRKTASKFLALTPSVEEGPYYKGGSPERNNIVEKGTPGQKLIVEGQVLDTQGKAIAHAWLDFWQADGKGFYDNRGYNLRGHQFANKAGRYRLETVRPFMYAGRTPHIHVKVRANEKSPMLTTQLFLPGRGAQRHRPHLRQADSDGRGRYGGRAKGNVRLRGGKGVGCHCETIPTKSGGEAISSVYLIRR